MLAPAWRGASVALVCALVATALVAVATPASAQGFQWPWEDAPVRPREPLNRPPPAPIPGQPGFPPPGQFGAPAPAAPMSPAQAPQGGQWMTRAPICVQLEQRLAQENQKGNSARDQLPKLEAEIRDLDRTFQQGENQLQRADCYDFFLFAKSLRNTRQCRDLSQQIETAKRRLGELETQRQQIIASSGRSYADDIRRELARNNCGGALQQDAGRGPPGGGSVWNDSEGGLGGSIWGGGASQYNTYRTVCVRLCDGYYFPVSFATLPQRFEQDAGVCSSKCAAPTELYYHPNPGGAMEQAVGAKTQEPYTRLKTAFRYREQLVAGCSCKEAEYVPSASDGPTSPRPPAPNKRADRVPPAAEPVAR
ncbi:MAG: DUF2865 domain-containing protein [Hyphomicrobiaceae bacterium]|nr:DUF2865 domain-containing protein [Hyphomicrobiaceae bacterium]